MSKYKVGNVEFVECPYCKMKKGKSKLYQFIHWKHLKRFHSKTMDDLNIDYPKWITMTEKEMERRSIAAKQNTENSRKNHKQPKTIYCIHCNKEVIVPKNHSNKIACKECLNKWLENPDGRTKESANINRQKTLMDDYGVTNARYIIGVSEKISKTNDEKYGGTGFASEELAEKSRNKTEEKYGNINIMKTDHGKSFFIGDVNPMKKEEVRKKVSIALKGRESKLKGRTYEEIHGEEKAKELKEDKRKYFVEKFLPDLQKMLDYLDLEFIDKDYINAHTWHRFKCKKCGYVIKHGWGKLKEGFPCPQCFPRGQGSSKGEREVCEYTKFLGFDVLENDRTIIKPKELDIVIPSKNIAIEYNGLYYHSTLRRPDFSPKYHLNKTLECKKLGLRLIHIFEDEWVYKNEIVKERLKHILGLTQDNNVIYARDCFIKEIDSETKNEFLKSYHIQGSDMSVIKLGLFSKNDELLSVMTFGIGNLAKGSREIPGVFELNRFCYKKGYRIIGAAGKLLEYFKRNYDWIEIFTYADLRWSNGNLYRTLGFSSDEKIRLDCWYTNTLVRVHKFAITFRKGKPKHISENIVKELSDYGKIWGCGNLKFILKNK